MADQLLRDRFLPPVFQNIKLKDNTEDIGTNTLLINMISINSSLAQRAFYDKSSQVAPI